MKKTIPLININIDNISMSNINKTQLLSPEIQMFNQKNLSSYIYWNEQNDGQLDVYANKHPCAGPLCDNDVKAISSIMNFSEEII